jgi:protein-disulfide isomerase
VNRRVNFALCVTFVLASVGALMAAPLAQKTQMSSATSASKAVSEANIGPATFTVNGVTDIDPTKAFGNKKATVTIEIFSDFQCPSCKQLFITTTQRLMGTYVNDGKLYVVHRDYPLPYHAYSRIAASYSRAAAHIGKCEAVEMALFQNQEKWEADGDVKGTVAAVLTPQEMKKVQSCVDSKTLEPLIDKDKQLGQTIPVNATPTIAIHTADGKVYPVTGPVSYEVLKTLLDQLIK